MTISYPLTLPSNPAPRRVTLTQVTNVASLRNIFSLATQKQVYSGQMWMAEVTMPLMVREDAEPLVAKLLSLNGPEGTFWLGDPTARSPRGNAAGSPKVRGAGQIGGSLNTSGWGVSVTGVLLAGDYIQIGNSLYKVLADVNSDGSGYATLDIWPNLRSSPSDLTTIITEDAKGLFQLAENTMAVFAAAEDKMYDISFTCVEAI